MGFGNPIAERAAIERTYEDTCTIARLMPVTVNNISKSQETTVVSDAICALSQRSLKPTNQTDAQNEIEYDIKLFISPDILVEAGDVIAVKRFGRDNPASTIMLAFESASRPMIYPTHQEVMLKERGQA